jgi:type IV pilus assembly protein PilN
MIRINLLPYREEIRQNRRRQFYSLLALVVILGLGLVGLVYMVMDMRIQNQESRNKQLTTGIASLNEQIKEVDKIKAEVQSLLNRKSAIEALQGDRGEAVHLLSEMVERTPGGIYLGSLTQTGPKVAITGYTQSSSRVANFMRNINDSTWMEAATLKVVKKSLVNGRPLGEFSLEFTLVKNVPETSAAVDSQEVKP